MTTAEGRKQTKLEDVMKKLLLKIADLRILDGYIGILGFVLFYRILALYHSTVIVFSFSAKVGHQSVFSINLDWNQWRGGACSDFHPLSFMFSVWGKSLIDTDAAAKQKLHEWSLKNTVEWKKEQAEKERLIQAAKEAGL